MNELSWCWTREPLEEGRRGRTFYYQDAVNSRLLYQKSKYMAKGQPGYEAQLSFDQRLNKLGLFDFKGFDPPSTKIK